ncbi:hypothetical protein WAX74_12100 [Psychrobacillus sp. FJAT-51614]|uniref:Uncharacterized protein n=1 Tax=Psychrobacillus mangrovi TaxID=3117745 RepID=A0ABU8F5T6_9BACI
MRKIVGLLFLCGVMGACSDKTFPPIDSSTDFVASLNTLEPSINFISENLESLETWELDKAYTGFELVSDDYIFLYGYTLEEAELFQISTGKLIATYPVHEGVTFAYAVDETIFVANGKENTVTSFDQQGNRIAKADAGRYPMSMIADNKNLYVINFKDTLLSVYNLNDLKLVSNWDIPKSSHGIHLNDNELWIGGHGEGSQANKVISKYNIQSGELQGEMEAPMMPIDFVEASNGFIYTVSHGNNYVYKFTKEGELVSSIKVGANPFSITTFDESLVVAGYDDHQIHFLQNGEVIKKVPVGKGPFQLITREASK